MRLLVVGSGGREHALTWKLAQSDKVDKIYCAPGNAGMAELAELVPIDPEDIDGLAEFAARNGIDLTVVGPEAPLVRGLVDVFEEKGLKAFGPRRRAARLEGSKSLAKTFMTKYGIPTAPYRIFDDPEEACRYIRSRGAPAVVKADGLAAGKGVSVATSVEEAERAVEDVMVRKVFGSAGEKVVVEDCLYGEEVSVLALTDGKAVLPLLPCQDHKRVFDGDKGPNTGGMGAYCPVPVYTPEVHRAVREKILEPLVAGMAEEGCPYTGVIYAGLMITEEGPQVLEFNCRFGDPEAQPLVILLKSDLLELMEAVLEGRLSEARVDWYEGAAVCVVMASQGYPGPYEKGKPIYGLENVCDAVVFHAGTALTGGRVVTSGGRVLGVTARGKDIQEAVDKAYRAVGQISFEGVHYRKDIAYRALARLVAGAQSKDAR